MSEMKAYRENNGMSNEGSDKGGQESELVDSASVQTSGY